MSVPKADPDAIGISAIQLDIV